MNVASSAVAASLGSAPRTRTAYLAVVLILGFASNVLAAMVSTLMSSYLPDTVHDLLGTTDAAQVSHVGSYVGSLFLVGWAVGGVALGWIGDRLGRVRGLTASVGIYAVATLAAAAAPDWQLLTACRFLTGIGVGATLVLSAVVVAEAWGARTRAIALGLVAIGYPIGIVSAGAISYFVRSWRAGFLSGVLPLVLAVLCVALLRESETWHSHRRSRPARVAGTELLELVAPGHLRGFLVGSTIFGTMLVGLWATFSWLPTWAQSLVGTQGGQQQRGLVMMLLGMGGILGGAVSGLLGNAFGRKGSLLICFAGSFLASFLLLETNTHFSPAIYAETAFLALFFGISQGILTAYIPELFPTAIRSTATGVCFNAGRLVTAAAVFFVGVLVPVLGGYGNAVFAFSATYVLGFLATLLGRETRGAQL